MAVLLTLLIAVATLAMVLFLSYHWSRRKMYLLASQLDGPPSWPIIGNGHTLICDAAELLEAFQKLIGPYKSPVRVWVGPKLFLFIKHPDQVQEVLSSTKLAVRADLYGFLEPFFGQGLFTASGTHHKNKRKLIQPLFNQKALETYSHKFYKHALNLVESLKKHVDGPAFDILVPLHDSIFVGAMDVLLEDIDEHSIDYKDLQGCIQSIYTLFVKRITTFWKHPDFIYKLTKDFQEIKRLKQKITIMAQEAIDSKVECVIERLKQRRELNKEDDIEYLSMLELYIDTKKKNSDSLSRIELVDDFITLVGTAYDTQSSAIAFTLMMLGMHLNIQEKVVEEVKHVLGGIKRKIEYSDVGRLKYMEMCIKEAMRLYALGPYIFRKTTEDFQLGNWIIPPDCTVGICIFDLHRDPNYWERPKEYYPNHFTSEAVLSRHPYAYVPFSSGPRSCIAQQYAYLNLKIIIGTILQHFVIECDETVETLKITNDVSIRPVNGHSIRLKERRYF